MKKRKTFTKLSVFGKDADTLVGVSYENCYCEDGVLKPGVGVVPVTDANGRVIRVASDVSKVENIFTLHVTKDGVVSEYLAIFKGVGTMYYYDSALNDNTGGWVLAHDFKKRTRVIETLDEAGNPRTYFCNEDGVSYYDFGHCLTHIHTAKAIGCFHGDRVFTAVEDYKIIFSKPYQFSSYEDTLTDSGHLLIPTDSGAICALVSFQGKLYVFCEYGIFEMYAVGNAQDFTLKKVEYNWGKIFGASVAVCSTNTDGIYFLTENGLCVFDGKSVKKTCKNLILEPRTEIQICACVTYSGNYHLRFVDKWGFDKYLVLRTSTGEGYSSFSHKGMGMIKRQGYCILDDIIYRLDETGTMPRNRKRKFSVSNIDLGQRKEKSLHTMSVRAMGEMVITISDGYAKKSFSRAFDGGEYTFDVYMKAKTFKLTIEMQENSYVKNLSFDYETFS